MLRRATAFAVLLGLLAAGCGQSNSPRAQLARYVTRVDAVELELRTPIAAVSRTGKQFATEEAAEQRHRDESLERSRQRSLLEDEARIRALREKLASLPAPAAAGHLRALLLQLLDGQLSLTAEVAKMVVFIPRFAVTLTPLLPAMRRLEPVLAAQDAGASQASVYATKAAALRRFASALQQILTALGGLQPPAVSRPDYRAQVRSLQGMSTNAARLASALTSDETTAIEQSLEGFDRAATSNQAASVQKAQAAAVRAYDSQVSQLARISQSISAERQSLADEVR